MIKDNNYYNLLLCNALSEDVDNSILVDIKKNVILVFLQDSSIENFLDQRFSDLEDFDNQLKCLKHDFTVLCYDLIMQTIGLWTIKHRNKIESKYQVKIEATVPCNDLVGAYTKRIVDNIDIYQELLTRAKFKEQSVEEIMADIGMSNRDFL